MTYQPITEKNKNEWIEWLKNQQKILNDKKEDTSQNSVFETPDGDVATGKDLVGNLLAVLTNEEVRIN